MYNDIIIHDIINIMISLPIQNEQYTWWKRMNSRLSEFWRHWNQVTMKVIVDTFNASIPSDHAHLLRLMVTTDTTLTVDEPKDECAKTLFFFIIYGPIYGLVCALGLVGNSLSFAILHKYSRDSVATYLLKVSLQFRCCVTYYIRGLQSIYQ